MANKLSADLTQPCAPVAELSGGDGAAVLKWSLGLVAQYNDCAARHNALVNAVK